MESLLFLIVIVIYLAKFKKDTWVHRHHSQQLHVPTQKNRII